MVMGKESNTPATHPVFMKAHSFLTMTPTVFDEGAAGGSTTVGNVDVPAIECADSRQRSTALVGQRVVPECQQNLQALCRDNMTMVIAGAETTSKPAAKAT